MESVYLPRSWQPIETSNRVLEAIARTARQASVQSENPALVLTTTIHGESKRANLRWAHSIITLPRLQSLVVYGSVAVGGLISPPGSLGHNLLEAKLSQCEIDGVGIANFLRHTPNLRGLTYSHKTGGMVVGSFYSPLDREPPSSRDWNIFEFVMAIGGEVGDRLEELFISSKSLHGSITPGTVSMHGFRRLRHLRVPLELAQCEIDALSPSNGKEGYVDGFLTDKLVPPTVQILSIPMPRTKSEHTALNAIVYGLRGRRRSGPFFAFEAIFVCAPGATSTIIPDQERLLQIEAEEAGVALHVGLHENSSLAQALDHSNAVAALVERPLNTVVCNQKVIAYNAVELDVVSPLPLR